MTDELISKYVEGKATVEEGRQVLEWVNESQENRQYFNRLKNGWVITHLPSEQASKEELGEMKRLIHRHENKKKYMLIYKVAAILVVPLLLWNGYLSYRALKPENVPIAALQDEPVTLIPLDTLQPYMTYATSRGVKGKAELPDGSVVWLNSDSYIRVPVVFDSTERVVEFSGEGFFDVVSNPTVPMIIKTKKNIELHIHGTMFNLASYKEDNQVTTSLMEGAITVYDYNHNNVVEMTPNTTLILDKRKQEKLADQDVFNASDKWTRGELIFDNTPFPDIVLKLERWYGINIVVTNPSIEKYTFTGHFYSESISQVLDLFQASSDLKYKINKNEVIISK